MGAGEKAVDREKAAPGFLWKMGRQAERRVPAASRIFSVGGREKTICLVQEKGKRRSLAGMKRRRARPGPGTRAVFRLPEITDEGFLYR